MQQTKYLQVNKLAWAAALAMVSACSTAPRVNDDAPRASAPAAPEAKAKIEVSQVESAITSTCRLSTIGLPCDPDGSGKATECEGVCWIDDAALIGCLPVAEVNLTITDLNGRICGDSEGRNCARSCENGACVDKNARLGTACRPRNNSSTCEGVCTLVGGEPECDEVTVCGNVGISDDGCTLNACNFDTFENGCRQYDLDNAMCEASKLPPVIEAGVSSEPPDAAVARSDAGGQADAAATQNNDAAAETTEPVSAATSDAPASDTAAPRGDGGQPADAGETTGDAGNRPPYVPPSRPTKVVGGACTTAPGGASTGGLAFVLAALALVTSRRRSRS